MNFQSYLAKRNMSMYHLSKISGVPKTTVNDLCSGKSSVEGCNAKTVYLLAKALGCSMEELMQIDTADCSMETGLTKDNSYSEKGLPAYLQKSV